MPFAAVMPIQLNNFLPGLIALVCITIAQLDSPMDFVMALAQRLA
jgi:hypothetical protein